MLGKKVVSIALLLLIAATAFSQVRVDDEAPDFNGTLVNGKYFSLHETVKDSIVVIFFMGYN